MKPIARLLLAASAAVLFPFCGNDSGKSNGGTPDGGVSGATVNVNGRVVTTDGAAAAGVSLVIKSGTAVSMSTRTDSRGNFAVANVPTPYDATVLVLPYAATVSVGLTSATPTVLNLFGGGDLPEGGSASLSGTVIGGTGFPVPTGYRTSVLFASADIAPYESLLSNISTADYTFDSYDDDYNSTMLLNWFGPAITTGTLHALQWLQNDTYDPSSVNIPSSYSGYGFKANVSLANGSTVTGQDIAMTAVTPATFAGTYTAPPGYTLERKQVALNFGSGGLMLIVDDEGAAEAFSYTTPNIPGATLILAGVATSGTDNDGAPGTSYSIFYDLDLAVDATSVTATPPAAAVLSLPLNWEMGVTAATPFSWTAVPGGVHLFSVGPSDGSSSPVYLVLTSGTSATIPDLSSAGLSLPTSATYGWTVFGLGPYADVEAASVGLIGKHDLWPFSVGGEQILNSNTGGFFTISPARYFTTAPTM
jgi:hypothetical protein